MKKSSRTLDNIEQQIKKYGWFQYCVVGGQAPRFCYTIGLKEKAGFELIFGGGYFYNNEEASHIVDNYAKFLLHLSYDEKSIENFFLRDALAGWVDLLMLGASDYHGRKGESFLAKQIVPMGDGFTLDVPKMDVDFRSPVNLPWRWGFEDWPFDVPENSFAVTDLACLRGRAAIQVVRWEDDQWECFSDDPDNIDKSDIRIVPLGVMMGLDMSLPMICDMGVEDGFIRDVDGEWMKW